MNKRKLKMIGAVILVVVIGLGLVWWLKPAQSQSEYQAVFLTNNQVYFGKLSDKNSRYVTLSDIYYIQVSQPLQSQTPASNPQANLNLVKLGSELHGPQSVMSINRDHILFIEDLKSDSQVVKAIRSYTSPNQ